MSKSDSNNSRREFLKISGLGLIGAAALGTLSLRPLPANAQPAKLPLVAETDPMAKSLGYHADATKVDIKKWAKRAPPAGKEQFCHSCILYNGGKPTTEKQGPCALFAGKAVAANGWCNSWAKNPAAKA
jgi:hypothetical protein